METIGEKAIGHRTLRLRGRIRLLERPLLMGIVNVTPDSFYDGGRHSEPGALEEHIERLLDEGADILDIGGYSSRPGASEVDVEEEWRRLRPALEHLRQHHPEAVVSVDTFRAEIARRAVDCGAGIINDISAGSLDADLLPTVAKLNVAYVLMHMRGTPADMQRQPIYKDVAVEVFDFLNAKLHELEELGVADVVVDPGFGFGKTLEDNYRLFGALRQFGALQRPLLVGISRKSMVYKLLNTSPEGALNGTTVLNTAALLAGADILRIHDVAAAKQAVEIVGKIRNSR